MSRKKVVQRLPGKKIGKILAICPEECAKGFVFWKEFWSGKRAIAHFGAFFFFRDFSEKGRNFDLDPDLGYRPNPCREDLKPRIPVPELRLGVDMSEFSEIDCLEIPEFSQILRKLSFRIRIVFAEEEKSLGSQRFLRELPKFFQTFRKDRRIRVRRRDQKNSANPIRKSTECFCDQKTTKAMSDENRILRSFRPFDLSDQTFFPNGIERILPILLLNSFESVKFLPMGLPVFWTGIRNPGNQKGSHCCLLIVRSFLARFSRERRIWISGKRALSSRTGFGRNSDQKRRFGGSPDFDRFLAEFRST